MKSRWIWLSLLVLMIGLVLYFALRTPPGLEARGNTAERIALYGMIAAIAGAISAVLGVIRELIALRRSARPPEEGDE